MERQRCSSLERKCNLEAELKWTPTRVYWVIARKIKGKTKKNIEEMENSG